MKIRLVFNLFALCALFLSVASCKPAKLSVADEQKARGEFYDAAQTYRKVYNRMTKKEERPQRGEVAYKMAECYRRLNQFARASAAYQNAIRYEYHDSMAYYYLGRSLQAEGKYQPAINAYTAFLEWKPNDVLAREGLKGCQTALENKGKRVSRYVVKQDKLFNSRRSDFAPMFLDKNLDQIYFTSTNEKSTGTTRSSITGTKESDIFFSKKNEKGEWQRPELVDGDLNSEADEGIVSFSPDGQTMYLTKARREPSMNTTVEIYTSKRSDANGALRLSMKLPLTRFPLSDTLRFRPMASIFILHRICLADMAEKIYGV